MFTTKKFFSVLNLLTLENPQTISKNNPNNQPVKSTGTQLILDIPLVISPAERGVPLLVQQRIGHLRDGQQRTPSVRLGIAEADASCVDELIAAAATG